jgi:hypothetical protein
MKAAEAACWPRHGRAGDHGYPALVALGVGSSGVEVDSAVSAISTRAQNLPAETLNGFWSTREAGYGLARFRVRTTDGTA